MTDFFWSDEARTRHLYIPGISGSGKTTLMANLALGDIECGDGPVIIIDPKGSKEGLVNRVIPNIPQDLIKQTFYLSFASPVPIDMMGYRTQAEKNLVKSDIITILKRFSFGSWGPTMQGTLNHLVPTLLEASDTTFLDVGRFLENKQRRNEILDQVSRERQAYWHENPPSKSDTSPIASRMSNFYEPPLSAIVGGKRGEGLDIAEIIDRNQILLVDTSPLSEDGLMLGALVMSRIQQAIFRRSPDQEHKRCVVYADEFHNFTTSAFNVMLSQARSFNLSLCLANQHPHQITDIWDDVKGNVSSYLLFRMDGEHAAMLKSRIQELPLPDPKKLEKEIRERIAFLSHRESVFEEKRFEDDGSPNFSSYIDETIKKTQIEREALAEHLHHPVPPQTTLLSQIPSLPIGEAIYISHDGSTRRIQTPLPPTPAGTSYAQQIIDATYAQYGPKSTVDKPAGNTTESVLPLKKDDGNAANPTLLPKRPQEADS